MAAYTAIDDPEAYFQVKTYSGTGSEIAVTLDGDTDMQPDMVWTKNREQDDGHQLFDAVRGVTKFFRTNNTDTEASDAQTLKSFDSDGFTVGTYSDMNTSGEGVVAWCWKESATAGFDMVAYTGTGSARTISHSLSAVPHMMIHKERTDDASHFIVYHHKVASDPETDYLYLDTTGAVADYAYTNDTVPTSSVFSLNNASDINESDDTYIAYLWSEKQGFSKFGSYTGNGNADGTFVYTGFRPAFVLRKSTTTVRSWHLHDNKRDPFNLATEILYPDLSVPDDDAGDFVDILSNGFKARATGSGTNASGVVYIYMAFAEAPFVNSNGVPCNAR